MTTQSNEDRVYEHRLAAIEADSELTILASMNQKMTGDKASQYIVYTDYAADKKQRTRFTISVFTPFENVDKYGHPKTDFQSQLLFEHDAWTRTLHLTVLETLGSESRLAFYDFQNMGLAQLALKAFLKLAQRMEIDRIEGNVSSFDHENHDKLQHIFKKYGFVFTPSATDDTVGKIELELND